MANSSYKSNDGNYTARDNTRVGSVPGYGLIQSESKGPIRHRIDVTEGPMGYIPFLGDGLQAWQAKIDYDNGDVLSAGIGAGTLLMPPALSKFLRKTKPTWGPWVRKGLNYGMDKASSLSPRVRAFLDKYVSGLEGELSKADVERVRKTVLDYQQRRDLEKAPLLPGIENDLPNYIEAKNIKVVPATNRENIINRLGLTETNSGLMRAGALNNGKRIVVFPGNANSETLGHEFRHSIQDEFDGSTLPVPVGNTNMAGFSIPKYDFLPLARLPLDTNPELDGVRSLLKQYNPNSSWHQKITELDAEVERARQKFHPNTTWKELYDRGDERLDKSLGFIRDRFHLRDNDEANYLMKTLYDNGYANGGKFIRAPKYNNGTARFMELLDDYASMLYNPYEPSVPEVRTPVRYEPQPHYGLYEYPASTGMAEGYPITVPGLVAAPTISRPEEVVEDLFSEEAMARRALKQRYAESNFDNKAKSHAGAMGAWQIMPITYKDYLGRGRGKAGDLNDPEYNRKVRDWVIGIIPRDLQDLYSENDAPRVKLAKIYGAYNWGAGNMRKYLRKQMDAGVDISNDTSWVEGLNPETKRYIKYLALDEDIPDSTYTNSAFEEAAAKRGYMKDGGKIYIKPSHRGRLTELKERTGKTEAELYNDGNPAHKKMVVFARNSRKWHGDGGLLDKLGSVYGNDRARMLDAVRKVKQNRFDGGGEKGDSTIVEELKPAVVTAYKEEPLYLDEPYVDPKDFFTRWYPNRRAQMADNMANYRSWVTGWPFGQRRRAEKNVDTYIDSMLRNNDNVKQYILKGPHVWGSYENYDFPNALNDPEARKILSEHVKAKYNLLGKEIPKEGFDDWDLRMEMYGANGFSYDNDKYHVFYAEPNPSMGTQFHELSHTLRSVPGELPKYDTSFGYNPITYQIDKIQEDLIKRPGFFAPINATNDYSRLVTPYGLEMKQKEPDDFRYYMTEEEVKARLNAVRANQGINPRRTITEDDLKEIKKRASDSDHKFLDFYTDEALLRFFNDVAAANNETLLENYAGKGGCINRKK